MHHDADDLSLFLFIADPSTLHSTHAQPRAFYTKVDDLEFRGRRYVLLKVTRDKVHVESLQLFMNVQGGGWKTVCVYYIEPDIWHFAEETEVMDAAIHIIGEHRQRMALFE